MSVLFLGAVALQMQVSRTRSHINVSGNTGAAYNTSKHVLADFTTSVGVGVPQFFLAAVVVLVGLFLAVVLR